MQVSTFVPAARSCPVLIRCWLLIGRHRLNNLRENLDSRRKTLASAKRLLPSPQDRSLSKEIQELTTLSTTLARARLGLVQELVEVFNVVEVGGRPQLGGRPGTKGEWMIGELVLPVPGDIRRESQCFPSSSSSKVSFGFSQDTRRSTSTLC
jgi:hypothetical protein